VSYVFTHRAGAWSRAVTLTAGLGLLLKPRRPQLLLAGETDLIALQKAVVKLQIDTDATGKVTRVDVVESSGSNAIDQPTRVAIYDWWFEPKKDSAGNPLPDRFQFTIGWR
jgi:TonB family protein